EITAGKLVERCDPRSDACVPFPGASVWPGPVSFPCRCGLPTPAVGRPGSGVSLDPAWSPDGRLLAYVKAPILIESRQLDTNWYHAHALYLWDARTGASRR